ncbi:STAS domain-containing protein [Streptomyces sp. DT24]|uniref:STAS domain-containing protein n=1 Tax=unclassified Streptomyces TaxID=2593676 RepID=UPI0023B9D53A|nr:STAS domain-containing protein [Streptomyces sp. AM 4-1-1]WEH35140.1 STAS domain-containing protein [Streptomyces sp. AM 4-1-1]
MSCTSYLLSDHHLVAELHDVIDIDNEAAVERELRRLLPDAGGPHVLIVDIHTPIVTATALNVLLRLRRTAEERGIVLCVTARCSAARRVFGIVRARRVLRVAATLPGAVAMSRGCGVAPRYAEGADPPPLRGLPQRGAPSARLSPDGDG